MLARALLTRVSPVIAFLRGDRFRGHVYCEERHRRLRGALSAVGHAQLDGRANAEQYQIKRDQILRAIGEHVSDPRGRTLPGVGVAS